VYTLQSRLICSYSRVLGHGQCLEDMFVPHVLGFLPSPTDESMVSRGCSQLEERGSIYLVDPIVTTEMRGEEVLASTLDRSRLWRQGPRWPGGSELCRELWIGNLMEISCLYSAAA
jgi:hypothetical protein